MLIDNADNNKKNIIYNEEDHEVSKETISTKWLVQLGNNCRYNAFITLIYFTITPFLKFKIDKILVLLNELNELIIQLSENVIIKIIMKLLYFYKRINLILIMQK